METAQNSYTNTAAMLICCSMALSTSNPPFYLDIVMACIATIYAVAGYKKAKSKHSVSKSKN
jgi:uncharacterized membrane protein